MTCKDCVHYEVCETHENLYIEIDITGEVETTTYLPKVEGVCDHFKNKADFVEVKHGEWEMVEVEGYWVQHIEESLETGKPTKTKLPICSCCGKRFGTSVLSYNFCPNCGADMRKEGADNG